MKTSSGKTNKRTRWITFVLYPENRYHAEYLEWCKYHEQGFYIVHDEEKHIRETVEGYIFDSSQHKDDKKKHIHCAIYFENARTSSAFLSSFPTVNYYVVEEDENGKPTKYSTIPVSCDGSPERVEPHKFLSRAENVNDIYSLCHYFIHDNFECKMLGKKQYGLRDVKMFHNDRSIFDKHFNQELECNNSIVSDLMVFVRASGGDKKKFIDIIMGTSNTQYLKYVESHTYFVDKFLFGDDKN